MKQMRENRTSNIQRRLKQKQKNNKTKHIRNDSNIKQQMKDIKKENNTGMKRETKTQKEQAAGNVLKQTQMCKETKQHT